jgi:hypothetical protein
VFHFSVRFWGCIHNTYFLRNLQIGSISYSVTSNQAEKACQ